MKKVVVGGSVLGSFRGIVSYRNIDYRKIIAWVFYGHMDGHPHIMRHDTAALHKLQVPVGRAPTTDKFELVATYS